MSYPHSRITIRHVAIGAIQLTLLCGFTWAAPARNAEQDLISVMTLRALQETLTTDFRFAERVCSLGEELHRLSQLHDFRNEAVRLRYETQLSRYRAKAVSEIGIERELRSFEDTRLRLEQEQVRFQRSALARQPLKPEKCPRALKSLRETAMEVEDLFKWYEQP